MLRQFIILALFNSLVLTSASSVCVTQCMACLMIGDIYCPMDTRYPTGGNYCLNFCHTDESSLAKGSIYSVINSLRKCRNQKTDADVHACIQQLFRQMAY